MRHNRPAPRSIRARVEALERRVRALGLDPGPRAESRMGEEAGNNVSKGGSSADGRNSDR